MDFLPSTAELTATLFSAGSGTIIGSLNILTPPIFDVRAYASYYLVSSFDAVTDTAQCEYVIFLKWFADPLGTLLVYQDEYHAWADAANFVMGGGFTGIAFAPVYVQDRIHGPYMQVTIGNASPTTIRSKNSGVQLVGTTRDLEPYMSNQFNAAEDVLPFNLTIVSGFASNYTVTLAASAQILIPCAPSSGRLGFTVRNGASQLTYNISYATAGASRIYQRVIAASIVDQWELVWPKRAPTLQLINAATAINTFTLSVSRQINPV